MATNAVKPESLLSLPSLRLSSLESDIYLFVLENWPTNPLEVAAHFGDSVSSREEKRKASTKYAYHLRKLVSKHIVLSKRMGNSFVVWPMKAEKLRAVYSILEGVD